VSAWFARAWIALITATWQWPQASRNRLARVIGDLLWWTVFTRRRVALANLRACFPAMDEQERRRVARECFRNIVRGVLDHSVLYRAPRRDFERYVRVQGSEHLLDPENRPLIMIAPHFVGLDAGGVRCATLVRAISIYSRQNNPAWDAWVTAIRRRFNEPLLIPRQDADMRRVIRAVKEGLPLYYLPDADLGPVNSIFVPFFGVPAATIPMVSRIARMTGAKVLMAVTEMTDDGYVLHIEPPWENFPGASVEEDTARMNRELETWVSSMPEQYLWTHRRFKTRPAGAPSVY
jgi:Kdo2-lipid IVA lauroyltransferase/acyltransferase